MKKSILAIDESKAIRFLLQTVLGKKYQVITASDGCAALYWLSKRNRPDLIITDPRLPDMADWELVEHIKTSGLYSDIPVIILSAQGREETAEKCRQFDIAEFFEMPFNPVELLQVVGNVVDAGRSEPELAGSRSFAGNLRVVKK